MADSDLVLVFIIGAGKANSVDIAVQHGEQDNDCKTDKRKHDDGPTK